MILMIDISQFLQYNQLEIDVYSLILTSDPRNNYKNLQTKKDDKHYMSTNEV